MNDYGNTEQYPEEDDNRNHLLIEAARRRVRIPGLFLQLFAALIIAFFAMNLALSLLSPNTVVDLQYDWVEKIQKDQPPEQRQKLPPREQAVKDQQVQGPIIAALWITAGVFIFVGGSKMKELHGFGWSIAGSILAIFPGMCCCCVGLLPGIWALVVLLNSDVKLAFTKVAAAERLHG